MKRLTAMVVGVATASAAHAQTLDKEIAACAVEKGDLNRLECYDQLARKHNLSQPKPTAAPAAGGGKWEVSDTRNPIDDSRTVILILEAESGKSRWNQPVSLYIRCKSNKTEMYISWHDYLGSDAYVTTRIGDQKATTHKWGVSTDHRASFHQGNTVGTIKAMLEHPSFVAQVTPYSESPVTATFDLRGMGAAIAPLRETCNW